MSETPEFDGGAAGLLDGEALEYLKEHGDEVCFDEGEIIQQLGDEASAFFVVLEGEVIARLPSSPIGRLPLARFGPRQIFGELAILRAMPVAVTFMAATRATLLRYPAEFLATALAECAALRHALLSRLADDVIRAKADALTFYQRTRSLADLSQADPTPDEIIAVSARMRGVTSRIEQAAPTRQPVLLAGEPGTGKMHVARLIHAASGRGDAPLIAIDCREFAGRDAALLLLGGDTASATGDTESFGALHLAHGGTLVLRGIDTLDGDSQAELARHLRAERDVETVPFPDVRLIATVHESGDDSEDDDLSDELRGGFETVIELPPLSERRREIVPLAKFFLEQKDETAGHVLTPSAEQALVSLKYRQRNVDELRSIVELAARVADGPEIRAEHIFSGFAGERPIGINLNDFWLVRWMATGGGVKLARFAVAAGFLTAAVLCLVAASTPAARFANSLVWVLWEPVVFGLFLLVGSLWCTVCPLSTSGRLAKRLLALETPPPPWVLRTGGWLSAIGFVLILWSEELFGMTTSPFPTGVMLLALVAAAVICCVLWQREVWCRSLCPLGRLGVALGPVAPLTVGARPSVCASTCTTHDCYKGNERERGCPVYHHPQMVTEAHNCKMCLTCLRSCPHGSTGLFLRPRLLSAWRLVSAESYAVPVALTVFFLSPILIIAQQGGALSAPLALTITCAASVAAAALLAAILTPLLQGRTAHGGSAVAARVACALLVLGWGPLMAYQMDHIPLLHSLSIVAPEGTLWARWPGPEISAVTLARVAFVVFAAVLSATILWNARGRALHAGERVYGFGWFLLIAGCTAYTFWCLWLVA
jgi:transcriptional regulator with AAA-type ATPase domain/polyferredoxin